MNPAKTINIENWYALAICILSTEPITSDKALIKMGLSETKPFKKNREMKNNDRKHY